MPLWPSITMAWTTYTTVTPWCWLVFLTAWGYVDEGDVVRLNPSRQQCHVMYRRRSAHNSFLVTERCNSNCIMCSQPPKAAEDSYIVDELVQAIPMLDRATREDRHNGWGTASLRRRLYPRDRVAQNTIFLTPLCTC